MEKLILVAKLPSGLFSLFLGLAVLLVGASRTEAQPTTTTLTDPQHVREFLEATDRIRCICLPSLPIQACSYNMCVVSSYLKTFIENRVREGMLADEIVQKMERGFGDSILQDSVVLYFQQNGNQGMIDSLRYGFGEKILAKPGSWAINATLGLLAVLGLGTIFYYAKEKNRTRLEKDRQTDANLPSTQDLQKQIRDWEEKL